MFGLTILNRSLLFVAKSRILATCRFSSFGQPTSKVYDIIKWLDDEGIKPYVVKRGLFTDNYTGINIHLKDSFYMSIITEQAVIMGAFAETAIFKEDEMVSPNERLGYKYETKRHKDMEELGQQIKMVKAAADKGELVDTKGTAGEASAYNTDE